MPTSYEDGDEEAGAIETGEEACAIQPPSRVALGLLGKMTFADPRETAANQSGVCACRCYPFKRFSRFTMDSMTAPNAGTSPNIIPDIAL